MLRWMNRSTAGGKSRAEKIAAMVEKIAGSDLSVDEFFRRYTVPFSRPQYFRYQARLAAQGLAGLLDGRRQGNRRKLTPEAEAVLRGAHQSNPRSEEHTSAPVSRLDAICSPVREKKRCKTCIPQVWVPCR